MPYHLYFDTETTSLIPGQICQLSYIKDGGRGIGAKNFFFTVDSMDPGAYKVHKLSLERLKILSEGRRFSDCAEEIREDFAEAEMITAHNFRFDYMFVAREFERIGAQFRYKRGFCTMRYFVPHCKLGGTNRNAYKFPKLSELGARFGVDAADAAALTGDVFFADAADLHDARYDASLMYLCVKKALKEEKDLKLLDKFTL
ncbi:MAG: 3'-5' exonuclease [Clostridiales bacterium]|jgi:DNA polymerase-3 subunit epsilon|nr:3'-5' exonuclease [Clostridiales bacterium]